MMKFICRKLENSRLMSQEDGVPVYGYLASFLGILIIFSMYIIPWVVAIYHSNYLMYVNAWDEESYLTYQAGFGLLSMWGYKLDGIVILIFQEMGFSGAQTNLVFDLIITPLTLAFFAASYYKNKIPFRLSIILAALVIFSPVLFNAANPIAAELKVMSNGIIFSGSEGYHSALRTPEPQLSLFILSVFIFMYSNYKFKWLLFVPVLLLYPFLSVVYVFSLVAYVVFDYFKGENSGLIFATIAAILLFIVIGGLLQYLDLNGFFDVYKEHASDKFIYTRKLNVPVISIFCFPLFIYQCGLMKSSGLLAVRNFGIVIYLIIILIANIHIVSGFHISYKNYYDYGLNFLAGVYLASFVLDIYHSKKIECALMVVSVMLMMIVICNINGSGISFKKREYKIWLSEQNFNQSIINEVISNPFSYYVNDKNFRGKVAYSNNKAIAPVFSYPYFFKMYSSQCKEIYGRMNAIIERDISNYRDNAISAEWDNSIANTKVVINDKANINSSIDLKCSGENVNQELKYVSPGRPEIQWYVLRW